MAVENKKSDLFRDELTGGAVVDALKVHGRVHSAIGTIANDAAASSGSTYKIAQVPSYAILHHNTFFDVAAWGFADVRIGTKDDVDALVSVLKSAATEQQPKAQGDANHGKPLWEMLGFASDPGGQISLYAHAIAGATGAGSMPFEVYWIDN